MRSSSIPTLAASSSSRAGRVAAGAFALLLASALALADGVPADGTRTTGNAAATAPSAATLDPNAVPPAASGARVATRWDDAFAAFDASDARTPPPPGGVLFVGSSSIRLWRDLERQFKAQPVVLKRGFGGSRLADCVQNLNRLVIRYRPAIVVVYAGDNDLASGSTPADVLRRFKAFVDGVHRELPQTRIGFVSIKPSPARIALLASIRTTNALVRDYVASQPGLAYLDVYTPMLDAEGRPRAELFLPDRLHLNASGYALWQQVIAPYVQAPPAAG